MTLRPLRHLSVSAIQDFLKCSLLWYGRRFAGWPEPESMDMAMGAAIHKALAVYHTGGDAELELLAVWRKIHVRPPQANLQAALSVLTRYQETQTVQDGDRPEVSFSVTIPGVPIPFIGIFDLLRAADVIGEWKSGRTQWTQERVDTELQATAYWYAYRQQSGHAPEAMVYHWLATGGPQSGQVTQLVTTRRDVDFVAFEALCQAAYAGMIDGQLRPGCPSSRCVFSGLCRRWSEADLDRLSERLNAWHELGREIDRAGGGAGRIERYANLRTEIEQLQREHEMEESE